MNARGILRHATASCHERVDHLYTRFNLSDPIEYRGFLRAQAAAFIPVEEALDSAGAGLVFADWNDRKRASFLRSDLADLSAEGVEPLPAPVFASVSALLGGLYVVEGSRLGGALLRRSLPPGVPARFLGASAKPGSWRTLLAMLDRHLCEHDKIHNAVASAQAVFDLFERAGQNALQQV